MNLSQQVISNFKFVATTLQHSVWGKWVEKKKDDDALVIANVAVQKNFRQIQHIC